MRTRGIALHRRRRRRWWLSTEQTVDDETAELLIAHQSIVDVGDTLPGCGGPA
jgi:hypothetical protein